MANLPNGFPGTLELDDHRLRHEIGRRTVTLVQPDRIVVATDLLQAGGEGVAVQQVGEIARCSGDCRPCLW